MTDTETIKRLRKIGLFHEMSDDELQIISREEKVESYKAGDVIFNYNEKGGTLYLINKGTVEITLPTMRTDSSEEELSVLREGDSFGELSFCDKKAHSAKAVAVGNVELLEIDSKGFEKIIKENQKLGLELLTKIIQRVANIVRSMNNRYSCRPHVPYFN